MLREESSAPVSTINKNCITWREKAAIRVLLRVGCWYNEADSSRAICRNFKEANGVLKVAELAFGRATLKAHRGIKVLRVQ